MTVWPSDLREDDRSCAWTFYNLVHTIPEAFHSDGQGDGDYITGLVQTSEATGSWSRPLWLLMGDPTALGP